MPYQVITPMALQPTKRNEVISRSFDVMHRVGAQLIGEKKAEIRALGQTTEAAKADLLGKDLLSVVVKSNMLETGAAKMDDKTELAQ